MASGPCIGCGFEIDEVTGELELKGIRTERPGGGTPQQWPFTDTAANPNPEVFPDTELSDCNGLNCDSVTGEVFAWPETSARTVRGESTLLGVDGGAGTGFIFSWSLDSDDFGVGNPWNDSGAAFDLSTDLEVTLANPSYCRNMLVRYDIQVGPTSGALDSGVGLNTAFLGNIWDNPDPDPGDVPLGFSRAMLGANAPGDPLDFNQTDGSMTSFFRIDSLAAAGTLAAFLPPRGETNFRCRMVGQMTAGSATDRDDQRFFIGGGYNIEVTGWMV